MAAPRWWAFIYLRLHTYLTDSSVTAAYPHTWRIRPPTAPASGSLLDRRCPTMMSRNRR